VFEIELAAHIPLICDFFADDGKAEVHYVLKTKTDLRSVDEHINTNFAWWNLEKAWK
jgi:hypothetical protein